jgi:hypothetical protein
VVRSLCDEQRGEAISARCVEPYAPSRRYARGYLNVGSYEIFSA